jgi:hypothetical protein
VSEGIGNPLTILKMVLAILANSTYLSKDTNTHVWGKNMKRDKRANRGKIGRKKLKRH